MPERVEGRMGWLYVNCLATLLFFEVKCCDGGGERLRTYSMMAAHGTCGLPKTGRWSGRWSFSIMNRAKLSALKYAAGEREGGLSSRFSRWTRVCVYLCCVCWCAFDLVYHLQTMPRETEKRTTKRSRTTTITAYLGHHPACSESAAIRDSSSRPLETIVSTRNTEKLVESQHGCYFLQRRMQKTETCRILNYWILRKM